MATSPVPDMAAPPGMCPGIAVLGGGGAGGDGDGDGSGGKDGAGGDGDGNGENGNGDGKNAQGAPDYKKYPECGYASHPVDVVTGRAFTHPIVDLDLPGPLPLQFSRVYSSKMADRDVGLGFGWAHPFGWELEVGRRQVRIWNEQGIAIDFPLPQRGAEIIGPWGWLLRRDAAGFSLDADDGVWRLFSAADERGKRFRLSSIEDRNRNRIVLTHDQDRLVQIVDSAGRTIRIGSTREGRIASLELKNAAVHGRWVAFATYAYDERGNLASVVDADGHTARYAYDDEHRLTADTDRTGLTFHFVYDREGRCVESWGDYPGKADPSLGGRPLPLRLSDEVTRGKGIHHCKLDYGANGYTEVADSTEIRRYFGNRHGTLDKRVEGGAVVTASYREDGHIVSRTDPMGGTTTYQRDGRGRLLALTDALGRTTTIERDTYGLMTRFTTPAGGVRTTERDPWGNPLLAIDETGATTSCRYDSRGLVAEQTDPGGGLTRFEYDPHGNLVAVNHADGATFHFTYDLLGRRLSATDPVGATWRYAYTNRGDLVAATDPLGGVTRYVFDGEGHVVEITSPAGRTIQMVWGGYHKVCGLRDGNGHWVKVVYGADGQPLEIHNELGEVHRYDLTPFGMILEEVAFDGTRTRYRYDLCGRLAEIKDALGGITRIVRDLAGDAIARELPDGTTETIERDALGNIVRASSGTTDVLIERDIAGRIVREQQRVGEISHEILSRWSAASERVERRTSLGGVTEWRHDHPSGADWLLLSPRDAVRREKDLLGREIARHLPQGAQIGSAFDAMGRLARRHVAAASHVPHVVGPHQPEWLGERPDGRTFEQAYRYDPDGALMEVSDRHRGARRYQHDAVGQLLAAMPEPMRGEFFRFDGAGNIYERTPNGSAPTEYGPGSRLLRRGDTTYRWNELGQLVEKRGPSRDGFERTTRFEWGMVGELSAVEDEAKRVEFLYDLFLRRVQKQVFARSTTESAAIVVSRTRFVWDGNVLAHEIKETFAASDDPVIEERSYCFEEGSFLPLAHRESRRQGGDATEGEWLYYVNGPSGAPERLVAGDGAVVCEIQMSAWGRAEFAPGAKATTPLRFQGQFEDDETGLCYNRFRYYDPDTGRYISQDPLGVDGGLNLYRYVEDPLGWADPLGLAGRCTCTITLKEPVGGKKMYTGTSGGADDHNKSVQKALSKTQLPKGTKEPNHLKGGCGEPRAMTNYLNAWEGENGKIKNHADLDKALDNIKSMDPYDNVDKGRKQLCDYCRAFLPALGGQKLLNKVKQEGAQP
jgi:RHS repeat-associated protein